MKAKKILSLLLLIVISLLPAVSKVTGDFPPSWFLKKFDDTILDLIPYGLEISFLTIVIIEIIAPIIMALALIRLIQNKRYEKLLSLGFNFYYLLFLILTFGSFLVKDYDNGFKDFAYFIGVVVIEKLILSDNKDL
jgi:hypothetical protein